MNKIIPCVQAIKGMEDFRQKTQMAELILNLLDRHQPKKGEWRQFIPDVLEQAGQMPAEIEADIGFKERDAVLNFADRLLGILMSAYEHGYVYSPDEQEIIRTLSGCLRTYTAFESLVYDSFQQPEVPASAAREMVDTVSKVSDEFYKGKLYSELLGRREDMSKLTAEAKEVFTQYTVKELKRYLAKADALSEDELENLEVAVDVCKYFFNDELRVLLGELLALPHNNVRFFALESLLSQGYAAEKGVVEALANDLIYADLTYGILKKYGQAALFPAALCNEEYLAKSDMVHWLTYPTELNGVPDEIELLGRVEVAKEEYFVFRFRSESDTLSDECKGEWLIGWTGGDGAFSNFDRLSDYEQKTPEKTLRYIARKLLK